MAADEVIPWHPVPEETNRYFAVGVESLDIRVQTDGPELATMVVVAPKQGADGSRREVGRWRLTFGTVRGYRLTRFSESRLGIRDFLPLHLDWFPDHWVPAMWEVMPSAWLTSGMPTSLRYPLHHFVIADEDTVYKLAAENWESEALPDGEEAENGY